MAVSRKAMTEGIRTPIILRALIDAALQSLSQKSEIFASSLYTREPLGCSRTSTSFNYAQSGAPLARYDMLPFYRWFAATCVIQTAAKRNALRRKAGGRMGYEIQGFPTGMSVFSRMAWSRASRFSSWVKR